MRKCPLLIYLNLGWVFCFSISALMGQTDPNLGSTCPPCAKNPKAIKSSTAGGQKDVVICVDASSFPSSDSSKLNEALAKARDLWNNTTDSSGKKAPYKFRAVGDNSCTVTIKAGTLPSGACASVSWSAENILFAGHAKITYPASSASSLNTDQIASSFAHEFGHLMGLANISAGVTAGDCTTDNPSSGVMASNNSSCSAVKNPQSWDVGQANKTFSNPNACTFNTTGSNEPCASTCQDWSCPGFNESCANYEEENYPPEGCFFESSCWEQYGWVDTYYCSSEGCSLLYSEYAFLGISCEMFDPCA